MSASRVLPGPASKPHHAAAKHLAMDLELLEADAQTAVLPIVRLLEGWEQAEPEDIEVQQLSGAMTNLVFRVAHKQQAVLLRVHASKSDLFERSEEIATFRAVSASGLGPQLLLLFANGRVEEFLSQHVTLAAADLRDPVVSAAIAAATAEFHYVLTEQLARSPQHSGPMLAWERLRQWLALAESLWGLPATNSHEHASAHGSSSTSDGSAVAKGTSAAAGADGSTGYGAHDYHAQADGDGAAGSGRAGEAAGSNQPSAAGDASVGSAAGDAAGLEREVVAALGRLRRELPVLEALLSSKYAMWVAMCHNDLQYGNIMVKAPAGPIPDDDIAAATADEQLPTNTAPSESHDTLPGALEHKLQLQPAASPELPEQSSPEAGVDIDLREHSRSRSRSKSRRLPDGSFLLPDVEHRPRGQSPVRNPYEQPLGSSSFGSSIGGSSRKRDEAVLAAAKAAVAAADEAEAARGVCEAEPRAASAPLSSGAAAGAAASASATAGAAAARLLRCIPSEGDLMQLGSGDSFGHEPTRGPPTAPPEGVDWSFDLSLASPQPAGTAAGGAAAAAWGAQSPSDAGVGVGSRGAGAVSPGPEEEGQGQEQLRSQQGTKPQTDVEFPIFNGSDDDEELPGRPGSRSGRSGGRSRLGRRPEEAAEAAAAVTGANVADGSGVEDAVVPRRAAVHGAEGMRLIDYEYSGFNPVSFDIANHWCEWAADYHGPDPAAMDYSRMPDEQQRILFLEEYLTVLLKCANVQVVQDAAAGCSVDRSGAGSGGDGAATVGDALPADGTQLSAETTANEETSEDVTAAHAHASSRARTIGAAGADAAPNASTRQHELRDMWQWLERFAPGVTESKQLGVGAFRRLVALLHEASLAMVCLSAAQWALWGWVQVRSSDVDYDFAQYARHRWAQYMSTRPPELQHGGGS